MSERIFVTSYRSDVQEDKDELVSDQAYSRVLELLGEGWKLDPFFHQTGRPWTVDEGHVWVLVKGSIEEILKLNPFVELPRPEKPPEPHRFADVIDAVEFETESEPGGKVAQLKKAGWNVHNLTKGNVQMVLRGEIIPVYKYMPWPDPPYKGYCMECGGEITVPHPGAKVLCLDCSTEFYETEGENASSTGKEKDEE